MKNCYYCKKDKPNSEFDKIIMDGMRILRGWCKKCCIKNKAMRRELFARIGV